MENELKYTQNYIQNFRYISSPVYIFGWSGIEFVVGLSAIAFPMLFSWYIPVATGLLVLLIKRQLTIKGFKNKNGYPNRLDAYFDFLSQPKFIEDRTNVLSKLNHKISKDVKAD